MIHAALGHYWRRFWSESNRDPKELGESVSKFIEDNYRDWQADLTLAWKLNRKAPEEQRIEPKHSRAAPVAYLR